MVKIRLVPIYLVSSNFPISILQSFNFSIDLEIMTVSNDKWKVTSVGVFVEKFPTRSDEPCRALFRAIISESIFIVVSIK